MNRSKGNVRGRPKTSGPGGGGSLQIEGLRITPRTHTKKSNFAYGYVKVLRKQVRWEGLGGYPLRSVKFAYFLF